MVLGCCIVFMEFSAFGFVCLRGFLGLLSFVFDFVLFDWFGILHFVDWWFWYRRNVCGVGGRVLRSLVLFGV